MGPAFPTNLPLETAHPFLLLSFLKLQHTHSCMISFMVHYITGPHFNSSHQKALTFVSSSIFTSSFLVQPLHSVFRNVDPKPPQETSKDRVLTLPRLEV